MKSWISPKAKKGLSSKISGGSKYQVFICCTPCSLPISFALHTYVVTNNKGTIHRFEVWGYKSRFNELSGYVNKDFYPPMTGNTIFWDSDSNDKSLRFKSRIIDYVEGDENSIAQAMIKFIENNYMSYPHRFSYSYFPGPNSNTFTKWFLSHFPEWKIKLPWNAFG